MQHLSLFSGIGGFEYAAQLMGWKNVAHTEINSFGQGILSHYWPNSSCYGDITKTDYTFWRGRIDVLTGGFPCQPYSVAGLQLGTEDERHLWPEMLRAIREIAPDWVVGENVDGLVNWNDGLVFEQVQTDLEAEGYEVQPYILPDAGVNAPHKRYRVWFVAHRPDAGAEGLRKPPVGSDGFRDVTDSDSIRTEWRATDRDRQIQGKQERREMDAEIAGHGTQRAATDATLCNEQRDRLCASSPQGTTGRCSSGKNAADAGDSGLQGGTIIGSTESIGEEWHQQSTGRVCPDWNEFPTQPPVCGGDDGFSTGLLRQRILQDSMGVISEKEIDKILSKAASKWRTESIKALGNAIVPQVVLQIFKAIDAYERNID